MMRGLVAIALALVLGTSAARADTQRVAVIVGHNKGNSGQAPLRYAEIDAAKVGRVLVELGGIATPDLFLVQGQDLATLENVLQRAKQRIAAYQRRGDRVIAIFYFSGHSDGVALELGADRFTFAALRRWLKETAAEVRVGLVDSCKSGALLATKGGTPGPAFSIRLTDDVLASGEALLTSSAADENALESKEIGGSFFTHHLVSGLRGAADASGDARVTLTEAYQYAYKHTITTSGATLAGPQHPTYDYRLTGQGELVLTELARPTAAVALPAGFDRALVIEAAHAQVIAELGRGDPPQVALVPGRYGVRLWKGERVFEASVTIAANERRTVRWDELQATTVVASRAKGTSGDAAPGVALAFALGGRAPIAEQLDALGGVRLGVRARHGVSLALDVTTRSADELRETSTMVFAGYRFAEHMDRWRASIGAEVGGGVVVQSLGDSTMTGAFAVAPVGELAFMISPTLAFAVEAELAVTWLKQDGEVSPSALPAVWLGAVFTP